MIQSVLKAIDILSAFGTSTPRLTLAELSDRLGMPKGTVHNLLATLISRGFIEKTHEGEYALGTTIVALTQTVRINVEFRDRAAPLLRELADSCRESVYLTALDSDYALYIYAVESPHRLLARTAIGDRAPLHCTSVGKAMLSNLSRDQVDAIVGRVGLRAFTVRTITDADTLHTELTRVREQGYAVDNAEHENGLYCIGAAIYNHRGDVIGACSVSGADPEILGSRLQDLSVGVMQTAQSVTQRMGYVPKRISSVIPSIA